jgi:membrane fusion protein, multidrug efflux system
MPPVAVTVETVERRDIPVIAELAARMEAAANVEIRANVEGRLIEMSFKEGNMVREGQMLFRIDPRHYQAEAQRAGAAVERAEAELEMAKEQQHLANAQSALRQAEANLLKYNQDVERLRPLAARRAVPARDLDAAIAAQATAEAAAEDARANVRTVTAGDRIGLREAQANLTAANAAFEMAKLDLAETDIRTPIGGLIGRAEVSVGNYVGRGELIQLATVSQIDPINVVFGISEALYLHTVNKIDRAALNHIELILADNSRYPYPGRYTNIGRAVDDKTGSLLLVAQFPNPKGVLLPGMTGLARLAVGNRRNAVLVSEHAVFDIPQSQAVYVVTSENKVELRKIVTDVSYQGMRTVKAGLEGGETVVVDGMSKLHPGHPVTPRAAR